MSLVRLVALLRVRELVNPTNQNIELIWVGPRNVHVRFLNGSMALFPI